MGDRVEPAQVPCAARALWSSELDRYGLTVAPYGLAVEPYAARASQLLAAELPRPAAVSPERSRLRVRMFIYVFLIF